VYIHKQSPKSSSAKSTAYLLKSPTNLQKSPACVRLFCKELCICAKEPYILQKSPTYLQKSPACVRLFCKELCICAKEPYISAKEPYISAKEPCLCKALLQRALHK